MARPMARSLTASGPSSTSSCLAVPLISSMVAAPRPLRRFYARYGIREESGQPGQPPEAAARKVAAPV